MYPSPALSMLCTTKCRWLAVAEKTVDILLPTNFNPVAPAPANTFGSSVLLCRVIIDLFMFYMEKFDISETKHESMTEQQAMELQTVMTVFKFSQY